MHSSATEVSVLLRAGGLSECITGFGSRHTCAELPGMNGLADAALHRRGRCHVALSPGLLARPFDVDMGGAFGASQEAFGECKLWVLGACANPWSSASR